jgi:hypothetical protein
MDMDQPAPIELKVGTTLLTLVLCFSGYQLLFFAQPYIFLDYVNFVTHETGGVLFLFFNQFFFMLGQNIYQSLIPLVFFLYFFRRKVAASWSFCLFWLGDSILQTGNYMKDASSMVLPIVTIWGSGGNDHDWNYIFSQTGLMQYSQNIGGFFWILGAFCIIASIGYLCYLSVERTSSS